MTPGDGVDVVEAAQRWARSQLPVLGITAVRRRPWASIWRVETADSLWWLKINSPETGYEPRLLARLGGLGSALVPTSIAHPDQPWALVADAGTSARDLLAEAEPTRVVAFWSDLLPRYAELQQALPGPELGQIGIPDFSPALLVQRFDELLDDRQWFDEQIAVDYSADVHRRVLSARPELVRLASQLGQGIASTVQHDDLHDGNVFSRAGGLRIIDWGDAVVAHPFATMRVTLNSIRARLDLDDDAPELRRVRDAYLEAWLTGGESRSELEGQLDLALRVAGLGRAAGWARALGTAEAGRELEFSDAVAGWMTIFADDVLGAEAAP